MSLLEGEDIKISASGDTEYMVDTARCLFIGMGAFEGIEAFQETPEPESVCFGLRSKTKKTRQFVTKADIVMYGCSPQLAGRFVSVINFTPPTKEVLYRVCEDALYEVLNLLYIDLPHTDDFLDFLLEDAASSEAVSGCRDIRSTVWDYVLHEYSDQLCKRPEDKPYTDPQEYLVFS